MDFDIYSDFQKFQKMKSIFISGLRRSGTTLLQRLLDGHPNLLVYPFEDCIIRDYFFHKKNFDLSDLNKYIEANDSENIFLNLVKNQKLSLIFNKKINVSDPIIFKTHLNLGKNELSSNLDINLFKNIFISLLKLQKSEWNIGVINSIWLFAYFSTFGIRNWENYLGWVTKCPDGGDCFEFYANYFTNFRVLHLVRDPRGFFASEKAIRLENFKSFDFGFLKYSTNLWANSYENTKNIKNQYSDNFKLIKYEDIVIKHEKTLYDISNFICVPYNIALNEPTFLGDKWIANSSHTKDKNPEIGVNINSVSIWKNKLLIREKLYIEWKLGNYMIDIGYSNQIRVMVIKILFLPIKYFYCLINIIRKMFN